MPHFFVPPKNRSGELFYFGPEESHHLAKVLRKKPGDLLDIFDGEGSVHQAQLLNCDDFKKIAGKIIQTGNTPPQTRSMKLNLYTSLIKSDRFDWLIEKVSELGVNSITPILSQRAQIKIKPDKFQAKINRWQKIVLSASKQSGRATLTQIFMPLPFNKALEKAKSDSVQWILWEGESEKSIGEALTELEQSATAIPTTLSLFIGPEGGFTIEEIEKAKSQGVSSISLGDNILRAETAAIASAARIML